MKNSIKIKLIISAVWLLISIPFKTFVYSQVLESPLLYKGGADSQVYKADTIILENTVLDEGLPVMKKDSASAGLSFLYSEFTQFLIIPFSYTFTDSLEFNLNMPYISKSLIDINDNMYSKSGYGDLKLGLKYYYKVNDIIDSITELKTALPTGDSASADRNTVIPMGYGSPVVSILQSFSGYLKNFNMRIFLNAGAVRYFKSEREIGSTTYEINRIYSFSTMIGAEYKFNDRLFFQLKANFINIPESEYTVDFEDEADNTDDTFELNDSIKSSDIIPAVKYGFRDDITGYLLFVIPVYEYQDEDIKNTEHRKWKSYISLTKKF